MRNIKEIKFRFWNKDEKKMYESMTSEMVDNLKEMYTNNELSNYLNENVIPLQYTGLKDKNGKEIYEGDYLSNGHKIVWDENECKFKLERIVYPWVEYYKLTAQEMKHVEVIGNVYQGIQKYEII